MSSEESLLDHLKRSCKNVCISSMFCFNKTKYQTLIQKVKVDIGSRKKEFGVEYLDLKKKGATDEDLAAVTAKALADINELEKKIAEYEGDIDKARDDKEAQTVPSPTKAPAPVPTPAAKPAAEPVAEPVAEPAPASAAE